MGTGSQFQLTKEQIKGNIEALQALLNEQEIDYCYVSSFDPHLNEYVPLNDCHRYYFTGFTGSVAEVLVPKAGKVKLFVDGRYHEQAPKEVDESLIEVVKVPANKGPTTDLKESLKGENSIAYEANRTPLSLSSFFKSNQIKAVSLDKEIQSAVAFNSPKNLPKIFSIESKTDITSARDKVNRIYKDFNKGEGIFLSALDDIAWVSNCRGYQISNLSSFYSRGLLTRDKVFIFIEEGIQTDESVKEIEAVEFITTNDLQNSLNDLLSKLTLEKVYYDSRTINSNDYSIILNVLGNKFQEKSGGLTPYKSIKDEKEKELMRDSFLKSSKAVANTIKWVRNCMEKGTEISELDVYNKTTEFYQKEGAVEQSFNTISGVGPNSSIVHFSSPSADIKVKDDDVILLDSGGYYTSGFATDKTRTFLASNKATPDPKLVEIATLVMKGLINSQSLVLPNGSSSKAVDVAARKPIQDAGYDYSHGTGHGVGIYVHEDGIRFSPRSDLPLKPGQVVSIEPGLYIPGFGGVRHENVVIVQEHPEKTDHVFFEPLVFIEFDETIIDRSMLTKEELTLFDEYQELCREKGITVN